jgi:hypothetical protein
MSNRPRLPGRRLHRRQILTAAGGAALLPLLPNYGSAADALANRPSRLLLVFHPNGLEDGWQPAPGDTLSDLGAMLSPLAPLAGKLCVVKGLKGTIHNEVMGHPQGMQGMWTGARIESDESFSGVPSVDQIAAQRLSQGLPFASLELGVLSSTTPHTNTSGMLVDLSGAPIQAEQSPIAAYRRLFGSVAGSPEELERARLQRKSVLDFAVGQLPRIRNAYGAEDRVKLDAYEGGIRELERRLDRLALRQCQSGVDEAGAEGLGAGAADADMEEIAELQRRLLVDAFTCDLTRVASLQHLNSTSNALIPTDVPSGPMHSTFHSGTGEQKRSINRFFVREVARLLGELDAVKLEDGRSLLDDTLVVWGTEMATGNHLNTPIPFFLAGSSAVPLGKQLDFAPQQLRHTRLLSTILQYFEITDVPSVGQWHDAESVGPVPELMP